MNDLGLRATSSRGPRSMDDLAGGHDAALVMRDLALASPPHDLEGRLGDGVHAVQVALGEQSTVGVGGKRAVQGRRTRGHEGARLAAPAEKRNTSQPGLLLRPLDTFAEESVRGVQRSL